MTADITAVSKGNPSIGRDQSFDGKPVLDWVQFRTVESEAHDIVVPYLLGPETMVTKVSIKMTPTDTMSAANYPAASLRLGLIEGDYDPDATPTASTIPAKDTGALAFSVAVPANKSSSSGQGEGRWGYLDDTTLNAANKLHPVVVGNSYDVFWLNTSDVKTKAIGLYFGTADVHALSVQMALLIGRTTS